MAYIALIIILLSNLFIIPLNSVGYHVDLPPDMPGTLPGRVKQPTDIQRINDIYAADLWRWCRRLSELNANYKRSIPAIYETLCYGIIIAYAFKPAVKMNGIVCNVPYQVGLAVDILLKSTEASTIVFEEMNKLPQQPVILYKNPLYKLWVLGFGGYLGKPSPFDALQPQHTASLDIKMNLESLAEVAYGNYEWPYPNLANDNDELEEFENIVRQLRFHLLHMHDPNQDDSDTNEISILMEEGEMYILCSRDINNSMSMFAEMVQAFRILDAPVEVVQKFVTNILTKLKPVFGDLSVNLQKIVTKQLPQYTLDYKFNPGT